jgi:hypothetical protein
MASCGFVNNAITTSIPIVSRWRILKRIFFHVSKNFMGQKTSAPAKLAVI